MPQRIENCIAVCSLDIKYNMTVLSTDSDKNHIRNFETKLSSTPTNSPFMNNLPRQQLFNESNGFRDVNANVRLSMYLITQKENDEQTKQYFSNHLQTILSLLGTYEAFVF